MRKAMIMLSFRNQASRRAWAGICLALFLAVQLFASSESLHKLIHPDADCADHHCAVTMLVQGQANTLEAPPLLVVFVALLLFLLPVFERTDYFSFEYRYSPTRAPPLV